MNITLGTMAPPQSPDPASPAPPAPPALPASATDGGFVRCVLYAMRTIFRVLPAIGSSSDHVNAPPDMRFKHFVIAGLLCAGMLVGSLIGVVALVVRWVN